MKKSQVITIVIFLVGIWLEHERRVVHLRFATAFSKESIINVEGENLSPQGAP